MADAMVTARMPVEKKEAANRVFEQLGTNASRVINDVFDYVIRTGEVPGAAKESHEHTPEEIAEAIAWADGLVRHDRVPSRYDTMTLKEAKRERLIARGLLEEADV